MCSSSHSCKRLAQIRRWRMDNVAKQNLAQALPEPEPPSEPQAANLNAAPKAANSNAAPTPAPYKKSAGDKLFDLGVYGGLGFVANAGISLVADRYATQLEGSKLYKAGQAIESGFARTYATFNKNPTSVAKWAKLSTNIGFLGSGGWLLLAPMKWLEDSKTPIIQNIDARLGSGPQNQAEREAQADALDTGPRQSMSSLFFGRLGSYITTIAFSLPLISDWTPIGKNFTLYLDKNFSSSLKESWKTPTTKIDGKTVPLLINSIGYEIILAGTASVLHYGASKGLAHAGHKVSNAPPQLPKGFLAATRAANAPSPPQAKVEVASHEGTADAAQELYANPKAR